jgi:hypothetical protein
MLWFCDDFQGVVQKGFRECPRKSLGSKHRNLRSAVVSRVKVLNTAGEVKF